MCVGSEKGSNFKPQYSIRMKTVTFGRHARGHGMISSLAVNTQQWRNGRIAIRAIYSNVCTDSGSV
jgi:hypothetical protein